MNPEIKRDLAPQSEAIENILESAHDISESLNALKVDRNKSRIFEDTGVRIEIYPNDERARGVYMCIRGGKDIVVGVIHGGHEHFDSTNLQDDVAGKALAYFKALLHAKQVTTDKLKHGKLVSRDTLFKNGDDVLSESMESEVLLNIFSSTTVEIYEFSFL
ncbi:MAG: hypothetical protein OEV42_20170 [Deltaproteobacteria bacterium]|nr:hypothetical protein [Deltaproteobacteria bacterium]